MRTLTLTVHNRPHYLKILLESLSRNSLDGYELLIGIEPGCEEVVEICKRVSFLKTKLIFNPLRLGVTEHPRSLISLAFAMGSNFNVALEDDLVLSPDAVDLANWFCESESKHFLALNLFQPKSNSEHPNGVVRTKSLYSLGWATTALAWKTLIEPNWLLDWRGWDFSINTLVKHRSDLWLLRPTLSRSNHIGREGGTHCTPDFHDKLFGGLVISESKSKEFVFCDR